MKRDTFIRLVLFAVSLAAMAWGYRLMLLDHAPTVFANPQEDMSFAWFVPIFSLYVLWRERRELVASVGRPAPLAFLILVPAMLVGFLGIRGFQVRFEIVGFIGLLIALTGLFWGAKTMKRVLFPTLFLLFCIPLATFLDVVTVHLRIFATSTAFAVLKTFGADVVRRGTMLASSTGSFAIDVAEPCSGLRSIFALMALTAGYAYFTQPTWLRRAILFALAVPLAIVGNVTRIVTIAVIASTCSAEFATGFYHDYSGYVVFGVALALMLACGAGITAFCARRHPEE